MATLAKPTYNELINTIQQALRDHAGFTNFADGSCIGTIIKPVAAMIMDLYAYIDMLEMQTSVSTASGEYLDKIGLQFGVRRLAAKAATTVGAGKAIVFSNPTSTTVTVPIRTRVWSPNNTGVAFYTTSAISVPALSTTYVDVTAASVGDGYNVGPGVLTSHNADNRNLEVTNVQGIGNGSTLESDDNYRFRIINSLQARQGGNEMAIRLRLLELPGVKDVVIQPFRRGVGTVDVIVIPVTRYVTQNLLTEAQAAAEEVVAFGIAILVKAPIERPIDITAQITVRVAGDVGMSKSLAAAAIASYVDNLRIGDDVGGGDMVYEELHSRIMDAHPDIRGVAVMLKVDNKQALNITHRAKPGEHFYLQSVKVL